jgi:hypothetical protein
MACCDRSDTDLSSFCLFSMSVSGADNPSRAKIHLCPLLLQERTLVPEAAVQASMAMTWKRAAMVA